LSNENEKIRLQDGRTLSYARYGVPGGSPVFYFTGGNSSRFEGRWFEAAAALQNVDLVVPDRPGFGRSDFQPNRQFLDWPDDVVGLADELGFKRFAVFGLSGGSPHVASLAYKIPRRLTRAAIVSGVAPPEMPDKFRGMWPPVRLIYTSARRFPALNRFLLKQMGAFYADPDQMLKRMQQALPEPDVQLIAARPEVIAIFSAAALEAHAQGIQGDAWEWQLYVHPWGFELADIQMEIGLWYGEYDRNAPPGMGRYLDQQIPHSRLQIVDDGGHFSTINNHIREILAYLCSGQEF
jgi:pimeloyl-ACP methyl ester carboxylesterase